MNKKDLVKDYLHFTYKERVAVIALVAIVVLLIILPNFFPDASAANTIKSDTSWMAAANKMMQPKTDTVFYYRHRYNEDTSVVASSDRQLRYYRYANYNRTGNYGYNHYTARYPFHDSFPRHVYYSKPVKKIENVEINGADSAAWEALPAIGPVLAVRIIKFRDKLGGFYSIDQVKEVYGIQDSTFQLIKPYLKINTALVHKINVNTATKEELKVHPYIRWQLANVIVDYRNQHGAFASIDDLKKIQVITDDVLVKVKPYITL